MSESKSKASDKVPPGGFQAPKGTRDFYPRDMLLRRYITDAWRRTALRHGFDEIDGPTFENAALYTVKSGDGILSELFSFTREGGDDLYALRPEFTPTLARMYAARAKQLPQPTKWFCVPSFFRAERPQRGRLREFFQWNCDVIGGEDTEDLLRSDSEVIATAVSALQSLGIASQDASVHIGDRVTVAQLLDLVNLPQRYVSDALKLLDRRGKLKEEDFERECRGILLNYSAFSQRSLELVEEVNSHLFSRAKSEIWIAAPFHSNKSAGVNMELLDFLALQLQREIGSEWFRFDFSLARGLAYYTGTVFEVIAEGERAVAGGGRYDNLIELFGGPPTPACGFGMGDVVLGNLLSDKGLVPEGKDLVEALSRPMPVRPDVFVVASPNDKCDEAVVPLVARLRRGVESERYTQGGSDAPRPWSRERYDVQPLHARRSYKSTKNVGKLLADAGSCFARYAAIIERVEDVAALEGRCTLKNLDTGEQTADVPLRELGSRVAR